VSQSSIICTHHICTELLKTYSSISSTLYTRKH